MSETISNEKMQSEMGTEAVLRTADVLLLFCEKEERGVSEIARQLDLSKSVVFRILRSLSARGFVVSDEASRKYRLGPAAAALGACALRDLDLRQHAQPLLRWLQQQTKETAIVSALVGTTLVYLDQVPSTQAIKMTVDVGRPSPLHVGASGKAILAFAPSDVRQHILLSPLTAITPRTHITRESLEKDIEQIRQNGFIVTFGERQAGAGSIAAALIGVDGYAVGSIGVCGPINRFDADAVEQFSPLVMEAARNISTQLGWNGVLPKIEA